MNKETLKTSHPIPKKLALAIKLNKTVSKRFANKLALKLFLSPFKYPTPELELPYKNATMLSRETVNNKAITVYHGGISERKVLLVHGWSGRATQFYKMAPEIIKAGFKVYSFTAPAHGSSEDKKTDMLEFADCIKYLDGHHGPFEVIIGHSIGATASLNAIKQGLTPKRAVILGAPGLIVDSVSDFCKNLGFDDYTKEYLIDYLKVNYGSDIEKFGINRLAQEMTIPGLIIHDEGDRDVSISHARENHKFWKNSEFVETKGLGHRSILSNETVINKIITFIK